MAINPVIHNDGGVNRFIDYLSTVPEFIKVEDDVVSMLQLFSDYINNAYRNTAVVDKFRFKLIATDNNVVAIQNDLSRLVDLFKLTENRGLKMLYVSKPEGNPRSGSLAADALPEDWPIFREYIKFDGTLDTLGISTVSVPNPEDEDKFFIEFIRENQEQNTGVYVYNKSRGVLQLDSTGTSQDPFNSTVNTPLFTDAGLAPRMLEFSIANVGEVTSRRAGREGTVTYYEVFFDATIFGIQDISGIVTKTVNNNATNNQDFNYIIDYYDVLGNIPSSYTFKYDIEFAAGCRDMDWEYDSTTELNSTPGFSMFYARDLTEIDQTNTLLNREGRNLYIDPIFSLNTSANDITSIDGNGTDVTITTKFRHSLSEDDKLSIFGTLNFDGNFVVSKVLSYNQFRVLDSTVGNETIGRVVTRNLFYSKSIDNPNEFDLIVPYTGLDGDREFVENDIIVRIERDIPLLSTSFDATDVDTIENLVHVDSLAGFPDVPTSYSLDVTIRGDGTGTLPTGLTEGVLYQMFINSQRDQLVSFAGIDITAAGTGSFSIYYEGDGRKYFDAATDVDLVENTITLSNNTSLALDSNIFFTTISPNISLPAPLETRKAYQVSAIDGNKITLDGVDLTVIGSGICDLSILTEINVDNGRVDRVVIHTPITSSIDGVGEVVLKSYTGDVISDGFIGRYNSNGTLAAFANIDTTAIVWSVEPIYDPSIIGGSVERYPVYYAGDLVVDEGIQYRVLNSVQIDNNSRVPEADAENYERYMDPIISRPDVMKFNPYMFGMHKTFSQDFAEEIDFTQNYSELGNRMYIQQVEDLALIYGFDQRQWLFSPRFAPQSNVVRNGSVDFVSTNSSNSPMNNEEAVNALTKANTVQDNSLFGVNTPIVRTVNSLTTVGGVATAQTIGNHGYKTGSVLTVQGSSILEANGSFVITVTGNDIYTYDISNPSPLIATGVITSTYQVNIGDFIQVDAQTIADENGVYVVTVGLWKKFDIDIIPNNSIVFCKQNLFTIGEINTSIATGELITPVNLSFVGSGVVAVTTSAPHNYQVGTTIEIRDAFEGDYNGRFEVELIVDDFNFQYNIADNLNPPSPATGDFTCQDEAWYQYRMDEIQWQKVSKELDYENVDGTPPVLVPFDNGNNSVDLLAGEYSITLSNSTVIAFTAGLIVDLSDQLISAENGIYRVTSGQWERLDIKVSMKIRDMRVNAFDNPDFTGIELDEEEVVYRTFSDSDVLGYINENSSSGQLVYQVTYPLVKNFDFVYEKVEFVDTAGSVDRQYNAKQDYNSVVNTADMADDFQGIPDMDYPLIEKIERIAYNKDPRAIDLDLIQYLARYLGYDITDWAQDIIASPYYETQEEVEAAIRRAVEQLPQYYTLKSTESGLELLLLTLGIVGELITMWTPQDAPYSEFIPDYQLRGRQYADMIDGVTRSYVPTPHFNINVNIAGNFENQILQGDQQRIISAIKRFKPINTVFNEIRQYITAKLKARITISKMNAEGKQKFSVGFENLDWTGDLLDNDCL